MGLQVVDCCRNRLVRRTLMECGSGLFSTLPSVAVHVVSPQMVVVDADGLPVAILKDDQNDGIALNRPPRLAEADKNPRDDLDIYCPLVRHGWQPHMPGGRRREIGFANGEGPAEYVGAGARVPRIDSLIKVLLLSLIHISEPTRR